MLKGYIKIFNRELPLYGLCFISGIAVAACVALLLIKKKKIEAFDLVCSAIYAVIGGLLGSKIMFVAVSWEEIRAYNLSFLEIIRGGFVFYGGLIGGVLGLLIYVKQFKLPMGDFFDVYATVLPLGHAFGRIGCFFGGCCYGMEMKHDGFFCVVYKNPYNALTPRGVPLLAIQLIEAGCLLICFAGMLTLFYRSKRLRGNLAEIYACAYAVLRFALEFFRGDKERGDFLFLSTSQWTSIVLILSVFLIRCIVYIKDKKKRGS